ncbi:NADP-dependent oxidoreductase [Indiicoccus explosivorum]|uniref:NADP-dependent oxidoreductase n=1 Tax=Indiicoccus explosivorum TaxID=1917864 RepID=UPI000B43EBDD|nr:NADP-dependent oxidoreductase [Indiicoccus explosivorum]
MKAVVIDRYGGKEELKERQIDRPKIKADQVLLEVYATSVNPIDWKLREGYLQEKLPFEFPIVLGWDAAGIIAETGADVTGFKAGDRVFARPATTRQGTYAEYTAVDADLLARMPEKMTFEEAAAIPLTGLTAWQCLVEFAAIQEGDKVLIHAGAGGVGNFAIQLAKSFGAYVATTASKENEEFVKSLGADRFIDYQNEAFEEVLEDYDIVLDTIGGDVLDKSYRVLKKGGRLVSVAGQPSEEDAQKHGVKAGFVWLEPDGKQLQKLADLYEAGELEPVIGETFELSEQGVREAHALSETHHAKGKIVLRVKS